MPTARSVAILRQSSEAEEVESALVASYLRTDGEWGAGPLRSLDATEVVLAEALHSRDGDAAVARLVIGCGGPDAIAVVLERGWVGSWSDYDTPGYFRYLVLSCAVMAASSEVGGSQDFGHVLRRMTRSDRKFDVRRGLPTMWAALDRWCAGKHDAGEPIRRMDRPPRGVGSHVGFSESIAFPNWRAIRSVRGLFEADRSLAAAAGDPAMVAVRVCPLVTAERGFRDSTVRAAESFRRLYDHGGSLLALHRFWFVVAHAVRAARPKARITRFVTRIELDTGVSARDVWLRCVMVEPDGQECPVPRPLLATVAQTAASLKDWGGEQASRWIKLLDAGAVPFRQETFGVWVASDAAPEDGETYRYLVASRLLDSVPFAIRTTTHALDGGWTLLGAVDPWQSATLHRVLGIAVRHRQFDRPLGVDGIRTPGGWLGRPAFMPRLLRRGTGRVDVLRSGQAQASTPIGTIAESDGSIRLVSDAPVDGLYRARLEESGADGEVLAYELPMRFVPEAGIHADIPSTHSRWIEVAECRPDAWASARGSTAPDHLQGVRSSGFDDLLEAVYAGGRGGLGEKQLVRLVESACKGPSPWEVVRALHEAGWLDRRIVTNWRATSWRLVSPRVEPLETPFGVVSVLGGSAPAAVRRRFVLTAEALGARVVSRDGLGPYSVATLIAVDVAPTRLAAELGWTLTTPMANDPRSAGPTYPDERWSISGYGERRDWDWASGDFRAGGERGDVGLGWLRQDRGERPDLYVVGDQVSAFVTPARVVAIAEAHRRARRPMLARRDRALVRLSRQGHLPLHLARAAHLGAMRAPGPVDVDGRWTYAYPDAVLRSVVRTFGDRFVDDPEARPANRDGTHRTARIGLARHRNGGWSRSISTSISRFAGDK